MDDILHIDKTTECRMLAISVDAAGGTKEILKAAGSYDKGL